MMLSRTFVKRVHHFPSLSRTTAPSQTVDNKCFCRTKSTGPYDAIIIGGGHNGLVSAAYLQKAGLNCLVLERRHVIGGAAVTEEIVPGFKFSRCSYVLSLLRPHIISDLDLKKHGLKTYFRDPSSYVPLRGASGKDNAITGLLLGSDMKENQRQIGQFSNKDAEIFPKYEEYMSELVRAVTQLLDFPPPDVERLTGGTVLEKLRALKSLRPVLKASRKLGSDTLAFYELLTAPASKVLGNWFESEPLKATLATDSVIGAMLSPHSPGSSYVLLHHLVGQSDGVVGAWGYPEGGMGTVSRAIAKAATAHGATVRTEAEVDRIVVNPVTNEATGVVLKNGEEIRAKLILSNATAKLTFLDLLDESVLPVEFAKEISSTDYSSPVTKINVAVDRIPNFKASPSPSDGSPSPHHHCTIHLNCENIDEIHTAYLDAQLGKPSENPIIEMCVPSSLDPTLAPPGCHVISLFTQFTPYNLTDGQWDDATRNKYADKVFDIIEDYAPGFKASVVGRDILSPPDLERIFGLTGGNIFHGAMSLDQLYFMRPVAAFNNSRSPIKGLYLCGSGTHPGGGVMGSPGYLAANAVLRDRKKMS